MLRVLFASLILLTTQGSVYGQMFGLGESRISVVSERTFGLSSFRSMRAEPVKAQPEPLPQLSGLYTNVNKTTKLPEIGFGNMSVPMICENGVCRPATVTRPRLFRRR
jgi:hypothetical protein